MFWDFSYCPTSTLYCGVRVRQSGKNNLNAPPLGQIHEAFINNPLHIKNFVQMREWYPRLCPSQSAHPLRRSRYNVGPFFIILLNKRRLINNSLTERFLPHRVWLSNYKWSVILIQEPVNSLINTRNWIILVKYPDALGTRPSCLRPLVSQLIPAKASPYLNVN